MIVGFSGDENKKKKHREKNTEITPLDRIVCFAWGSQFKLNIQRLNYCFFFSSSFLVLSNNLDKITKTNENNDSINRNNTIHNILVWLGRMKLKEMRLKYSNTHTGTSPKKDTLSHLSMWEIVCMGVCFFIVVAAVKLRRHIMNKKKKKRNGKMNRMKLSKNISTIIFFFFHIINNLIRNCKKNATGQLVANLFHNGLNCFFHYNEMFTRLFWTRLILLLSIWNKSI